VTDSPWTNVFPYAEMGGVGYYIAAQVLRRSWSARLGDTGRGLVRALNFPKVPTPAKMRRRLRRCVSLWRRARPGDPRYLQIIEATLREVEGGHGA